MKKVGIIDSYISNFHSNTYHKFFREIFNEEGGEEYVITHIYAVTDLSPSTKETTAQWCEKTGAKACSTIEEVCDSVDVIMVLAPNHPDLHEELCKIPFKSGKPVYVDKTFAPDYATAKRIIDYGKAQGANFWSSSATRFESSVLPYLKGEEPPCEKVTIMSGNTFDMYCIHLIELMNTFMGNGAKTVKCTNNSSTLMFEVDYGGKTAWLNQYVGTWAAFGCFPEIDGKCRQVKFQDDFWKNFSRALLEFFETGVAPIPTENTLECIAIRSAMIKAMENPQTIVEVEGAK